jgi:hypothetical protein
VSTSRRPYEPGKVPAKGKLSGTETFSRLSRRRWGFTNLGTWVVRDVRNQPGTMSQHATGRALDLQYVDRAAALEACAWFVQYADQLGVALINDYMSGRYGRTWLCSRAAWRTHTTDTIGIRGHWLHVELHGWAARMDAGKYEQLWRDLPRP